MRSYCVACQKDWPTAELAKECPGTLSPLHAVIVMHDGLDTIEGSDTDMPLKYGFSSAPGAYATEQVGEQKQEEEETEQVEEGNPSSLTSSTAVWASLQGNLQGGGGGGLTGPQSKSSKPRKARKTPTLQK
jgi:hypothetical protein